MKQIRWRSKAAWLAVAALILFVLKTYFKYEVPEADQLINLVLIAATALGIINNPTDSKNF